jgi:glycosyltransferase involved in cell wall biosynthesis
VGDTAAARAPADGAPMSRRRVLVVHYTFPPLGGGGVPRVLKFVKYLPQLGWDVTVLTCRATSTTYEVRDETMLAEVPPGVRVVRAPEVPVGAVRRRLRNPLLRLRVPEAEHFVGWPDQMSGWVPGAIAAAARVVREWHPSVVFSSSFPYSAHLVGLAAARIGRVPWVADFRDEWTLNPQGTSLPRPLPQINARAERALVRRADRVVLAAAHLPFVGLAPDDPRRIVILNGVDETDFEVDGTPPTPPADRFRLTYVGSLYGSRDAASVLASISRLVAAGVIDVDRFELAVVGNAWVPAGLLDADDFSVDLTGYVGHERAIREMQGATALLFYAPATTRATSGKIFEYLLSGRPILSVARADNLAHSLVADLGAGVAAEPDDPQGIDDALATLYGHWQDGSLAVGPDVRSATLERFSRRRLTADLANVLDAVARG